MPVKDLLGWIKIVNIMTKVLYECWANTGLTLCQLTIKYPLSKDTNITPHPYDPQQPQSMTQNHWYGYHVWWDNGQGVKYDSRYKTVIKA